MRSSSSLTAIAGLLFCSVFLPGCMYIAGLFYSDWRTGTVYRSSSSKRDYYVIEGVTQSHCGCSDIVVKGFSDKKPAFTFYYGGGLFPAKKYIYKPRTSGKGFDTLQLTPVTHEAFTVPFDSLDHEILRRIDSILIEKPKGVGLVYEVKGQDYKGFIRSK